MMEPRVGDGGVGGRRPRDRAGELRSGTRRIRQWARRDGAVAIPDVAGDGDRRAHDLHRRPVHGDLRPAAAPPASGARARHARGHRPGGARRRVGPQRVPDLDAEPPHRRHARPDRPARLGGAPSQAPGRARVVRRRRRAGGRDGGGGRDAGPTGHPVLGHAGVESADHQGQSPGLLRREPAGHPGGVLVGRRSRRPRVAARGVVRSSRRGGYRARHAALQPRRSGALPPDRVRAAARRRSRSARARLGPPARAMSPGSSWIVLLIAKIVVSAGFVLGATAAVERLGPRLGALIAATPQLSVVALIFFTLEQGPAFAAESAFWTIPGMCATIPVFLGYLVAIWLVPGPRIRSVIAGVALGTLGFILTSTLLGALPLTRGTI